MSLTTVIGRGHSGTRAMSHTLTVSGVFMGAPQNRAGDLLPPEDMYEACRVFARHVKWTGDLTWDFSEVLAMDPTEEFVSLIQSYLKSVLGSDAEHTGWKIPETTLVYPWILKMFPQARYIFWVRDPRDCILGEHLTDDLGDFGIEHPRTDDVRLQRAISWKYQDELVKVSPRPVAWARVRLEDMIFQQDETLANLEKLVGFPLEKTPMKPEVVGRYKTDDGVHDFDFLQNALREYGYIEM